MIRIALVFSVAASMTACLVTKGAVPLTPQLQQDSKNIWIYLETNKSGADGVYRCYDANSGPSCLKAELQH